MRTIETTAIINRAGEITVQVPADILPGEYRIAVVVDEQPIVKR